jgi:hypothetical protein
MPHESVEMGVVVAQPADACKPLENDVRGKAVLVRRGGCPFVQKAEQVRGLCLVFSCMRMGCSVRCRGTFCVRGEGWRRCCSCVMYCGRCGTVIARSSMLSAA